MSVISTDVATPAKLSSPKIIEVVADRIKFCVDTPMVVDPVMVAKSGDRLLHGSAVVTLRDKLLPIALIVTPNIPEAETLAGITIANESDRQEAARIISSLGPKFVVIKGGHRDGDPSDL